MNTTKRYVVLTSGGDAPGMNAAVRAIVRSGVAQGAEMFGSEMGYEGLIKQKLLPLSAESVANTIQRGGTILKSARSQAFYEEETQQQVADFLHTQNITGLVVLGGNGSFQGAKKLEEKAHINVIGIPCTIDNDIAGTDYCIGFDTCCNTALQAIDKIRDTALSFDSNFLVEVMGRSSGFIAAEVGTAGGAEFILTPEFPMTADEILALSAKQKRKKLASIIVAAEADQPGWTINLAKEIKEKSGIDYRVCVLGHTQRGGTPTAMDRLMATRMGYHAIELLQADKSGLMVSLQDHKITSAPFRGPADGTRFLDHKELLLINQTVSCV